VQVLYEPVYDTLRTKQQLGYTVSSGARLTHGVCGFCVVVVSAAVGAAEVEARIEAFLQDFTAQLQVRRYIHMFFLLREYITLVTELFVVLTMEYI
jgi:secreted Zn-dependent insulinase-like peptidase